MQSSERARELDRVYQSRRGHAQQLSISDDNHHVTEAIGDMYGDSHPTPEFSMRSNRPLSFVSGPSSEKIDAQTWRGAPTLARIASGERVPQVNGVNGIGPGAGSRLMDGADAEAHRQDGPIPPGMLNRKTSDTASHEFELNLDYSKPEDVAQELSNLQAIRRMSMDVNSQDPDLPSFNPNFRVPSLAPPTHGADEGDPSRLFWVPARLHPELAPKEFKTFIEDKVKTIKRTSAGEEQMLSADGLERQGSASSSLRRKKSMLSRQIDSGVGYEDGTDRLERKRSQGSEPPSVALKDLENVLTDPTSLVRKISIDASRTSLDSGISLADSDSPILASPAGSTLKRSTRTQYRKGGSLRRGEKLPFPKRLAARQTESDSELSPTSPGYDIPEVPSLPLSRVQTEPIPPVPSVGNFSRPGRRTRAPATGPLGDTPTLAEEEVLSRGGLVDQARNADATLQNRTDPMLQNNMPVPQIIETPPPTGPGWDNPLQHPQRSSSRGQSPSPEPPSSLPPQQPLPNRPRPAPQSRPSAQRNVPLVQQVARNQTFDDIAANPSSIPGNASRTDVLSVIPTIQDDGQKKKPKNKEESRKGSWGWLGRGSDEKEKDKERERMEREDKELTKKTKARSGKSSEVSDSGRLDVLQQSIDGGRSRESLVLDRSTIRLDDDHRRKEGNRKSTDSNSKKEKDGIFSSFFGKKKEKEPGYKKGSSQRGLSPDPPQRILKPDIDYNWTRFSIMEERAIYRMAHIKLANPRRELYSQVLLSNFMYSYLAKVQSQHPQFQVAGNMQSKRGGRGSNQKQDQQPEEFAAYQRYQEQQARNESQHQQQQQEQQMHHHNQQRNPSAPDQDEDEHQNYHGGAVGGGGGRQDPRGMQQQHQQQSNQYGQQQHHQSYGQNNYYNGGGQQQQAGMVQGGQSYGGGW